LAYPAVIPVSASHAMSPWKVWLLGTSGKSWDAMTTPVPMVIVTSATMTAVARLRM
jgi:hypothetical protein